MKLPNHSSFAFSIIAATLLACFGVPVAQAHPYASGVTGTNGAGAVSFVMNEAGATVDIVFDDGTTNSMGVLPKGSTNFSLGSHTSFQIICFKAGNGVPFQISDDTFTNSTFVNARGVDVNKNPKVGSLFGRMYVGNSGPGGIAFGSPTYKAQGLYVLNADQTDALGYGTNAMATALFAAGGAASPGGPWRLRVNDSDNTVIVGDDSPQNAAVWQFSPDLLTHTQVLAGTNEAQGIAAGVHGRIIGTPYMTGSLAAGNMVLWTGDASMGAPTSTNCIKGPGTSPNSFNCLFRYNIGAGPLPWNHPPDYAYTVGLDGIANLRVENEIGKDGKIIAGFGRANLSNPDIQILNPSGSNVLWTSWNESGGAFDPWRGEANAYTIGTYAGVRVSPDGVYLASVDINAGITIGNLTNGIPDDGSLFGIVNAPSATTPRGMCWDAADNIWVNSQFSSPQNFLRCYSLGITTTCITSNDFTGNNGSFVFIKPGAAASVTATTPTASQNYVNNTINPGAPIPGVFTVSLNVNSNPAPVVVSFVRAGSAVLTNNYNFNYGTNADGVVISQNSIIFPSGLWPHAGNWSVAVQVIPTATPVIGPTLTVSFKILGGTNYSAGAPINASISILNTGPQLLTLSAAANGGSMNRGIPGDYARFVITRTGDLNGPGNDSLNISSTSYTVTNFNYYGTAQYPVDFTALAQVQYPTGPYNELSAPTNGGNQVVIPPGATTVNVVVGNPIKHTNPAQTPTNLTIIVNTTNKLATPSTNAVSSEGLAYSVTTAAVTLNELDNTIGRNEVVLWSNPLTNSFDSTNWTVVFANTAFDTNPVLPAVITNYPNDQIDNFHGGTNDFIAAFGKNVADDGVPLSDVMVANGWNTALKLSVNKQAGAEAGLNLYPQGQVFEGNYALRFDMFLSIYQYATNSDNTAANITAREYAAFGLNHFGTNCNWRLDANPRPLGTGSGPTNSDGVWCCIDAGYGAITPADYDLFTPPALPNQHGAVTNGTPFLDQVSNNALSQSGVFKHPPFSSISPTTGGEPVDQWVDVSFEVNAQTNLSLYVARQQVLANYGLTNTFYGVSNALGRFQNQNGAYIKGTPMLGYLDPNASIGDPSSCFVMFSNVRVVRLSPYITNQPVSMIVTQGMVTNFTFTSGANLGSDPITNVWYRGASAGPPNYNATAATFAYSTNLAADTGIATSLTVSNSGSGTSWQTGTNFMSVFSDAAGSVTSLAAVVEVILGPTNGVVTLGSNFTFRVTGSGNAAPTAFQWQTNGVNLTTNAHFNGVRSANLFITNCQPADGNVVYTCLVTNAYGYVAPSATLTIADFPGNIVVTPANQTNLWGSTASFTVSASGTGPFTYRWKTNGVVLNNNAHYGGATSSSLFITNVTRLDQVSYTAGVTNAGGSGALSSAGALTVLVPPPTISSISASGGNITLSITTTNNFDNTNGFILQSAGLVTGPYTNNTTASFTGSSGSFQVIVPQTGDTMFYRLLHAN